MSRCPGPRPPAARARRRFGLFFAAIWLVFLYETAVRVGAAPLGERLTGWAALAAFVGVYLHTMLAFGRAAHLHRPEPAGLVWLRIVALAGLVLLVVPAAGAHAAVMLIYVTAAGVFGLPTAQGGALAAVLGATLFGTVLASPELAGPGLAIGFTMATAASFASRRAQEHRGRLAEARDELATLAVQQERARIAADLHDILGHSLTVVTVKAELARRLLDVDPERARAELADLERLSRDALADVRATARGIRGASLPGEIAAAGVALAAADIEADLPTATDEVPSARREVLARVIREAVTNVVRHSGARHCTVRLRPDGVEVVDDGAGPPPGADPLAAGDGLAGLRQRVEAAGGVLTIGDRADGAPGFQLTVTLRGDPPAPREGA
ncbi:histidine kinase [Pilimelia anulata]|uniref:Histidine kinase n=1 Tax=Pilimelia anulata TaxID=53371 RepID=A0A8J3B2H5_9ACTN|nr:sensor histidine kinase [Pilimelia anulata]GGJ91108.1 histidine kinase [Pilimelia anulata]